MYEGVGFCDCGNTDYLKESGFCPEHARSPAQTFQEPAKWNGALKEEFGMMLAALILYSTYRAKGRIRTVIYEDVLLAWNYILERIRVDVETSQNSLLFFLDVLVCGELTRQVPEHVLRELVDPMLARVQKEHAHVNENLMKLFGSENKSKICFRIFFELCIILNVHSQKIDFYNALFV